MPKKRVCVITATRAEYGLLYNLMLEFNNDPMIKLQIIATGAHLSPEFGLTYKKIEEDGFVINEKIEMLLSSDTSVGVAKSMGLASIGFADAFERLKPDVLIILGDRYEMLAVAQVALVMGIPIAHIHGGELTFGAYDDAIRHSITKMSTWHFTSTESHKKRVIQLGEAPERVWNVGALAIENILSKQFLDVKEVHTKLCIDPNRPYFLITMHPETNGGTNGIVELLRALDGFSDYELIFTKSNADNGGRYINHQIEEYVSTRHHAHVFDSLGQDLYLNTAKYATAVIGNSSSGLIEIPYLDVPTVNIGNRQKGREQPHSVFQAECEYGVIQKAIESAISFKGPYEYIFGDGKASKYIYTTINSIDLQNVQKEFYDL